MLPSGVDHLAAPEGAATLLVAAVSLETGLPVAVVRKEPKAYGTMSQVEGHAPARSARRASSRTSAPPGTRCAGRPRSSPTRA